MSFGMGAPNNAMNPTRFQRAFIIEDTCARVMAGVRPLAEITIILWKKRYESL